MPHLTDIDLTNIPYQNKFGAVRRFDIHTGVDIFLSPGTPVHSFLEGTIVSMGQFTGENVGSPWWNDTYYVVVHTEGVGYLLYGEITPVDEVRIGTRVTSGDLLGVVKTVLKKDKNAPTSMLHLEYYSSFSEPVVWELGHSKPYGLEDPTELLTSIVGHRILVK